MENKSNKTIVLECYRKILRDLDLSLVDDYVSDNYIQHSPTVKDGKAGLLEMLNFLKTMAKPAVPSPTPIIRMIAGKDLVAVHLDIKFMGKRAAVVDIFRIANGKLVEHWDAGQVIPDIEDGPVTMTNGCTVLNETISAAESKKVVDDFYSKVVATGKFELAGEYLTPGYIDHHTVDNLFNRADYSYKIQQVIAQGDFVVVHCECESESAAKNFALCSIFRIEDGKIAEHWSVEQEVPEVMAHQNGMF